MSLNATARSAGGGTANVVNDHKYVSWHFDVTIHLPAGRPARRSRRLARV